MRRVNLPRDVGHVDLDGLPLACRSVAHVGPSGHSIPGGHDSWVLGDEDYESTHLKGGESYARSTTSPDN
jgi:hypothetical protein